MKKKIIFTDLDGTLLDHDTYSFLEAEDALQLVKDKDIPLLICTSKTRSEIEYWRKKLDNTHPFISENGGGVFIPKEYFAFDFDYDYENENYFVIQLGKEYNQLVKIFDKLKKEFDIIGFSDMSVEQIASDTSLSLGQAEKARQREFSLPFKIQDRREEVDILKEINQHGLKYAIGGRYYHLMGDNDKGKAVKILSDYYRQKFGSIYTIGIGDSKNDFTMLEAVDSPYLVMREDKTYASNTYSLADGIGPDGWRKAVEIELKI